MTDIETPGRHGGGTLDIVGRLQAEARSLGNLLESYLYDRHFINQKPNPGKLLFFIDSHDLKAYIDPSREENLTGFVLEAERLHLHDRTDEIKLKSEHILHELLFDTTSQVGLFPSHGEEVDIEIAYKGQQWLRTRARLLRDVNAQADKLREDARRYIAPVVNDPGNESLKHEALVYFKAHAPALLALLRHDPDSPNARIKKLVSHSNLTRFNEVNWARFGFSDSVCARLQAFRPAPEFIEKWRSYLDNSRGRQQNSYRANRVDAEAIAYIYELNQILDEVVTPRVGVRLITRAMTLVNAVRDKPALEQAGLREALFLRHPRLTALREVPADVSKADAQPTPEHNLIVALQIYGDHLITLKTETSSVSEADVTDAVETLVKAWHNFEVSRLAAPPPDSHRNSEGADELQRLIDHFRADSDVIRMVNSELLKSIEDFGSATFNMGHVDEPKTAPALIAVSDTMRHRVLPLVPGMLVPVEFGVAEPAAAIGLTFEMDVRPRLDNIAKNSAERYLARALHLACRRQWELAAIYAKGAADITPRSASPDAKRIRDEALLLHVQMRRLLSGGKPKSNLKVDAILRLLAKEGRSLRVACEYAARTLDLHLAGTPQAVPDTDLERSLLEISRVLALGRADALGRMTALAMILVYHLVAQTRPELWPEGRLPDADHARRSHSALCAQLRSYETAWPGLPQPHIVCAMEIIGYQMVGSTANSAAHDRESRLAQRPGHRPPLCVPTNLQLECKTLFEALSAAPDPMTRTVAAEMAQIVRRIELRRRRELVYAPVWAPYSGDMILALMPSGRVHKLTSDALDILRQVAGVEQTVGVGGEHFALLDQARSSLDDAVAELHAKADAAVQNSAELRRALFHVRMEACYARLLIILVSREEHRIPLREELARMYREIARDYEGSAIAQFRLNVVLSDLSQALQETDKARAYSLNEEAREAITLARALIGKDPYIAQPTHWISNTILRRYAGTVFQRAAALRKEWHEDRGNSTARDRFEMHLQEAFQLMHTDFNLLDAERGDFLHRLDATRRANNIVYYASCFIAEFEVERGMAACLEKLGLAEHELDQLLDFLSQDGVGSLTDKQTVHTIGYAYFVRRDFARAAEAGDQIVKLISEAGDNPRDKRVADLLDEAFNWMRTDGGRTHRRSGSAIRGFSEAQDELNVSAGAQAIVVRPAAA